MDKNLRKKNWIGLLLAATATSAILATLLNVGKALASVSWNR